MKLLEQDEIETFSGLVKEHQAGLRAFVRALGVDDVWVDDLAQEAFLVAYRRRDDFDPEADFGKWLRGIARRLVANERRKAGRRSRLLHDSLTDLLMEAAPSEEPAAIRAPDSPLTTSHTTIASRVGRATIAPSSSTVPIPRAKTRSSWRSACGCRPTRSGRVWSGFAWR